VKANRRCFARRQDIRGPASPQLFLL